MRKVRGVLSNDVIKRVVENQVSEGGRKRDDGGIEHHVEFDVGEAVEVMWEIHFFVERSAEFEVLELTHGG